MSESTFTIQLSELLGALSTALDMTEGQPVGHSMRVCWIGTNIGMRLGLEGETLRDLYYTLLLKDVGCTSNAARICQLFLTDDIAFKRDFLAVDNRSLPKALNFLLHHAGMGKDLAERFRALVSVIRQQDEISRELIDTRCTRGADIARRMRFNNSVAEGILSLDEHWDGKGHPHGLKGHQIPLYSQIALMAQVADVIATSSGIPAACQEIQRRAGKWFDPNLVRVFDEVALDIAVWDIWSNPHIEDHLFTLEPARAVAEVDEDYLDDIALAFAEIIDSKSPYTSGHSNRVTLFTDLIAEELGIDKERRRWLRRAAMLHDIGKLGISSQILDKPGKLDTMEWAEVMMHPVYTHDVLSRVAAFDRIAEMASAHHERLDGKGYPNGIKGDEIQLETRIITVADIFDALTAERPYRPAMPIGKALAIMDEMVGTQIDGDCYNALRRSLHRMDDISFPAGTIEAA